MSNENKHLCHVGDYAEIVKEHIRQDVCQNLSIEHTIDSNGYCLLHAPTAAKDRVEFDRVFKERIKGNHSHFEAVVFPIALDFTHSNFTLALNFSHATFLSNVGFYKTQIKYIYFDYAKFYGLAQFHRSSFSEVATFTGATFQREAWFTGSYFKTAAFDHVRFNGPTLFDSWVKFFDRANFAFTRFSGKTAFDNATFESSVSFDEAEFSKDSQVSFLLSSFHSSVSFKKAVFAGYLNFEGGRDQDVFAYGSTLSLRKARLEAPEKVSFHNVRLRPNWFVDTDSRKFVFASVRWENDKGKEINARDELAALENRGAGQRHGTIIPYRLLAIAYRQLAENAEANNRFEEASMFRRLAMDTEWLEKKIRLGQWFTKLRKRIFSNRGSRETSPSLLIDVLSKFRKSGEYFIHGLYRWTSYYGESWIWASTVLLLMLLVIFPLIYTLTQFQVCPPEKPVAMSLAVCEAKDEQLKRNCQCANRGLGFGEAVVHSLTSATLQNVDYRRPTTKKGEAAVIAEKIFAPLQVALLALALRRKFMR